MDRSQLKREYKEKTPLRGVFVIRNKVNQKVFLTACPNLPGIMTRHKFQLQMGSHQNSLLQQEWKEYGEENFVFEILDQLKPNEENPEAYKDELVLMEKMWLNELQPYGEKGYNKMKK